MALGSSRLNAYTPYLVTTDGQTIKWDASSPVTIVLEDGACGTAYSNADMVTRLSSVVETISGISQSQLSLALSQDDLLTESGGAVSGDINGGNYSAVLALDNAFMPPAFVNAAQNPLLLDEDGQITADFAGVENVNMVLGFAYPFSNPQATAIIRSEEVINCFHSQIQSSAATLDAVVIHELLHGLGSGHSQLDDEIAAGPWPLMYPYLYDPTLKFDDEMSLASLYPHASLTETFWSLSGTITDSSGAPIIGANLVLRNIAAPDTEVLSYVSGTSAVIASSGSTPGETVCTANCSAFHLQGLTPGATYELSIEPINPAFTGGSGIGRYDPPNPDVPTATFSTRFSAAAVAVETISIACTTADCRSADVTCSTPEVCQVVAPASVEEPEAPADDGGDQSGGDSGDGGASDAPVSVDEETSDEGDDSAVSDGDSGESGAENPEETDESGGGDGDTADDTDSVTEDPTADAEAEAEASPQSEVPESDDSSASSVASGCHLSGEEPDQTGGALMLMGSMLMVGWIVRRQRLRHGNTVRGRWGILSAALISLMAVLSSPVYATSLSPDAGCFFTLSEAAPIIVDATVTKREAVVLAYGAASIPAIRYTFTVHTAFKGSDGETLVVDQYPRVGASYTVGERYVLFLTSKSRLGLQNALGFNAGRFAVTHTPSGLVVGNGLGNTGLFSSCDPALFDSHYRALSEDKRHLVDQLAAQEGGAVAYSFFVELLGD